MEISFFWKISYWKEMRIFILIFEIKLDYEFQFNCKLRKTITQIQIIQNKMLLVLQKNIFGLKNNEL